MQIKNKFSADYAQSDAERILNRAVPGRPESTKSSPFGGAGTAQAVTERVHLTKKLPLAGERAQYAVLERE